MIIQLLRKYFLFWNFLPLTFLQLVIVLASANPKVLLYSYVEVDGISQKLFSKDLISQNEFKNDFIEKQGDIFIAFSTLQTITFVCEADYPIRWTVPFPQQFKGVGSHEITIEPRASSMLLNLKNGTAPTFKDNLNFLTLQISQDTFLSGNFTCEAITSSYIHKLSKGIYVFTHGAKLQGQGSLLRMNLIKTQNKFVLPCRVASPELEVNAFKAKSNKGDIDIIEDENFANVTWLPLSSRIHNYFPMIGFILDAQPRSKATGLYKCSLNNEPDVVVYVEVLEGDALTQKPLKFEPKEIILSKSARVSMNHSEFICCNPKKPPLIGSVSCRTENHCDIWKLIWMHDINLKNVSTDLKTGSSKHCPSVNIPHFSKIVSCQSPKEMDVVTQIISVFDNENGTKHLNKHLYDSSSNESLSLEEKITFRFASSFVHPQSRGNYYNSNVAYVVHSEENELIFPPMNHNHTESESDRDKLAVTYLTVQEDSVVYEGESLYVLCYSLKYFYTSGGWLRLKWKNGKETYLPVDWNDEENQVSYMTHSIDIDIEQDNVLIGNIPEVSTQMESVECLVQPWNVRKWDVRKMELDVKPGIPPKYLDSGVTQTIQNGDGKLNCLLKERGKPSAVITWKIDGKPLESSIPNSLVTRVIYNQSGSFIDINSLDIVKMKKSVVFECNVKNKAGHDVQYFKVGLDSGTLLESKGRGSKFWTVTLVVTLILTILSLCLAVFILLKEKIALSLTSVFSFLGTVQQ